MREPTLDEWINDTLAQSDSWWWDKTQEPDAWAVAEAHTNFAKVTDALGDDPDLLDAFAQLVEDVASDCGGAVREGAAKDVADWLNKRADPWQRLVGA